MSMTYTAKQDPSRDNAHIYLDTQDGIMYSARSEEKQMPRHTNITMLYGDPENYEPPMSIAVARKKGFTDFTFYPTLQAAVAAGDWQCLNSMLPHKAVTFDEVFKKDGHAYVMHVLAETPRPRPVIKHLRYRTIRHKSEADNPALNAFAVFIAEWAAKIKNTVSR